MLILNNRKCCFKSVRNERLSLEGKEFFINSSTSNLWELTGCVKFVALVQIIGLDGSLFDI